MTSSSRQVLLAHVDLETTGLEPDDHVLEVAVVLTDGNLRELAEYSTLVRPKPSTFALIMRNDDVRVMHIRNGLLAELEEAAHDSLPTISDIEADLIDLVAEHSPEGGYTDVHIAGGGVANFDVPILRRLMPRLMERIHYRPIDVSMIAGGYKAAVGAVGPFEKSPSKAHRALADVRDDLKLFEAAWSMFREHADRQGAGSEADPVAQILAAANIIQATTDHAPTVAEVIGENSTMDVIAGSTAIAAHLAGVIAEREGRSVASVLDDVRKVVLRA